VAGPDPDDPAFAAEFRADIGAVSMMGLPEDPALRPIFHFEDGRTYANEDSAGRPWDWTASPTDPEPPAGITAGNGVGEVLVAVEAREGETDETTAGTYEADEYILTFLDDEWAKVSQFTWVSLGGRRFKRGKTVNPIGLNDVTVHQVRVEADPDAGGRT
jgi:hypothetical protein